MTGNEIADRLIEIARLPGDTERELALKDLKRETGATLKALRADLDRILTGLRDLHQREAVDPILQAISDEGWFMLMQGAKVWVGRMVHVAINGHSTRKLEVIAPGDFVIWQHHRQPLAPVEQSPGKLWLRHPETPHCDGVTIDPSSLSRFVESTDRDGKVSLKLNLWTGFDPPVAARDDLRATAFRGHVLRLCSGDAVLAAYLLDWLAWGFQHPGKPIGTVPVLIGEQGTGKGMLGNLIAAIWSGHGLVLRDKRSIVGDFNAHLAQCAFAFVDEAFFVGDRAVADRLKGMITDPTLMIEAKWQQRVEMTNMLKIMMASNHEHAIQAEFSDRRYVVIRVPDDMPAAGDPYWAGFVALCHGYEGRGAILFDLLHRDLSSFHPERDRPATEAYTEQKLASLNADTHYWQRVADEGTLQPGVPLQETGPDWPSVERAGTIDKGKLYGFYAAFHSRHLQSKAVIADLFYRRAREIGLIEEAGRAAPSVDPRRPRLVRLCALDAIETLLTAWLRRGRVPGQPREPDLSNLSNQGF